MLTDRFTHLAHSQLRAVLRVACFTIRGGLHIPFISETSCTELFSELPCSEFSLDCRDLNVA